MAEEVVVENKWEDVLRDVHLNFIGSGYFLLVVPHLMTMKVDMIDAINVIDFVDSKR